MSVFAIGDIHGCWTSLQTLWGAVGLRPMDIVVLLGDYVDRGPKTRQVVDWVMEKSRLGAVIPLRGNHEIMMLDAVCGRMSMGPWLEFGGVQTLASYGAGGQEGTADDIPTEHLKFLDQHLLPAFETKTHLFVHGGLQADLPLNRQSPQHLYWERFDTLQPHVSGKQVICGHTAQTNGWPHVKPHAVCIDTYAYGGGWLTCLNVESGQFWQANEQAAVRIGHLDQLAQ